MDLVIEQVVGAVVWVVALLVYMDARRRGRHGFTRFVAFWVGFPGTFLSMFVVREGSQPDIAVPRDDERALLEEVRRERAAGRTLDAGGTQSPDAGLRRRVQEES
jgi:hypothetical protein